MDFTFDERQLAFRDSIRRFLLNEVPPELIRELWETDTGRAPRLWQALASHGLTAVSVPESEGGMGLAETDWVLVAEESGYFALPEPLLDTALVGVGILDRLPDQEFASEWLARIAEGGARVAVGCPGQAAVADAHVASLLLLGHEGELHALRPRKVSLHPVESVDPSARHFRVEWEPGGTRVAEGETAAAIWDEALDRGALGAAAQQLGLAQRMLDLSIDHATQRQQFGRPVGSFQAVKHRLADIAVQLEFARPVVHRAAYALAHGDPDAPVYVSHAKVAASETALAAGRAAIQVHGAVGYTWDLDLHIFMKRAWALDAAWGERSFHMARVTDHALGDGAELGAGSTLKGR